jgi:hypothetical protein
LNCSIENGKVGKFLTVLVVTASLCNGGEGMAGSQQWPVVVSVIRDFNWLIDAAQQCNGANFLLSTWLEIFCLQ